VLYHERRLKKKGFNLIIGVDEAGRGPLAGPVVAAAVTLKTYRFKNRIDDSKKLTPVARERAFPEIINKSLFGIGIVDEKIIDRINILRATGIAMEQAVASLVDKVAHLKKNICVIVDGNMNLDIAFPYKKIIKGDSKSLSIASASILAKVTRDRIMELYDKMYPKYRFYKHKGYPTKEHRAILKKIGPCLIHRKSFCYGP
jgi:ribonuclease HII